MKTLSNSVEDRWSRAAALAAVTIAATLLSACGTRSLVAVRESGRKAFERGDYQAAISEYKEYVDRSPGNALVYHDLGKSYLAAGETGMARENLLLAHSLRVEDDAIFKTTCEGLFQDKKLEELNRLLRARTVDRGRMQDFLLLGEFSERQGDVDEAQRAYLTAAQVDGGVRFEPHLALAQLYKRVGDRQRYLQRLSMAYWAGPNERAVVNEVKSASVIPGPTFGVTPPEAGGRPVPAPAALPKPAAGGTTAAPQVR
jgi:tetratricopeptide (TPR) repeat protein